MIEYDGDYRGLPHHFRNPPPMPPVQPPAKESATAPDQREATETTNQPLKVEVEGKAITRIDDLDLAAATADDINAAISRRMSGLLKAHHELALAVASANSARGELTRLHSDSENSQARPETLDDAKITTWVHDRILFNERMHSAYRHKVQTFRASVMQARDILKLADQLSSVVSVIKGARPDLASDATMLFDPATEMQREVRRQHRHLAETELPEVDDCATPAVSEANALAESEVAVALEKATVRLFIPINASTELASTIKEVLKACDDTAAAGDIKTPVRPTEEEVQRYMMQLERRMAERLRLRREAAAALAKQDPALNAHTAAVDALQNLLGSVTSRCDVTLSAAIAVAREALSRQRDAYSALYYCSRLNTEQKAAYDSFERAAASTAESTLIDKLRPEMRAFCYSLGRLNEAKAVHKATEDLSFPVDRSGIAVNQTLKQALQWLEKNDAACEEARKKTISREVKLELLAESVAAYEKEVAAGKTKLHRELISLLPRAKDKPCDELRALFNGAAWLYNSLASELDEGVYPLY